MRNIAKSMAVKQSSTVSAGDGEGASAQSTAGRASRDKSNIARKR